MNNTNSFLTKIKSAVEYRKGFLLTINETTAFRIFNSEGDGISGLTIDYFNGYYLITWFNTNIYQHKEQIVNALKSSFFI